MDIYLIRHAQTPMNAGGKVFSGSTDVSLSEEGVRSTIKLAGHPLWKEIEHVYITPLIRTRETADLLFSPEIPRTVVPGLAEMDFGDYEGRMMDPDQTEDLVLYNWVHHPEEVEFPNGEKLSEHAVMALQAFQEVARIQRYERIAVISHKTTIRLILSQLLTGSVGRFRKIPCDNGCVTRMESVGEEITVRYINAPFS